MERVADDLDLEYLRKISGVCVSDPDRITQPAVSELEVEGDEEMAMSPSELGICIYLQLQDASTGNNSYVS